MKTDIYLLTLLLLSLDVINAQEIESHMLIKTLLRRLPKNKVTFHKSTA